MIVLLTTLLILKSIKVFELTLSERIIFPSVLSCVHPPQPLDMLESERYSSSRESFARPFMCIYLRENSSGMPSIISAGVTQQKH